MMWRAKFSPCVGNVLSHIDTVLCLYQQGKLRAIKCGDRLHVLLKIFSLYIFKLYNNHIFYMYKQTWHIENTRTRCFVLDSFCLQLINGNKINKVQPQNTIWTKGKNTIFLILLSSSFSRVNVKSYILVSKRRIRVSDTLLDTNFFRPYLATKIRETR